VRFFALAAGSFEQAAQHAMVLQALVGAGALNDFSHDDQWPAESEAIADVHHRWQEWLSRSEFAVQAFRAAALAKIRKASRPPARIFLSSRA
jgi:hypothetical protein